MNTTVEPQLLELTQELINCKSITPNHGGSLNIIEDFCKKLGMYTQRLDKGKTKNLYASSNANNNKNFLFCGHVDVVDPGEIKQWKTPPFTASILDESLHGRGAVDMKSSIAAMLLSFKNIYKNSKIGLSILITSDEEGDATEGTVFALEELAKQKKTFTWALVGEPTSNNHLGDTIKTGRRGSLTAYLTIFGKQGHVAYPQLAKNPIFMASDFISLAKERTWDDGHSNFPKTQCCIMQIKSDANATNIIPEKCTLSINFRYSPKLNKKSIQNQVEKVIQEAHIDKYSIQWNHSATPFFNEPKQLAAICKKVILNNLNINSEYSTSGGTSDARFVNKYTSELVELGPLNKLAHKIDEAIPLKDLQKLYTIYREILVELNNTC